MIEFCRSGPVRSTRMNVERVLVYFFRFETVSSSSSLALEEAASKLHHTLTSTMNQTKDSDEETNFFYVRKATENSSIRGSTTVCSRWLPDPLR